MRLSALLCVAMLLLSSAAIAQAPDKAAPPQIAAGLAETTVEVKVNYSGARIVLFAASPAGEDDTVGFAVALIGPSAPYKVIHRAPSGSEQRFNFISAPSVFAIGAESQVVETTPPEIMIEAGLNAAAAAMPNPADLMAPDLETWRAALVDLKMEEGLYSLDETTIERLEGGLRRARIILPPNAPPGDYKVRAVAFRNGQRIGETEQKLTLVRGGMDATLFDLSKQHGFIYGLLAVLLGFIVGGIAAWVGRR